MKKIGLDIGSTTIKCVVLDEDYWVLFTSYQRHKSCIKEKLLELLTQIRDKFSENHFELSISGSSALGIANKLSLPFVQEVYALQKAVEHYYDDADVVIELGGEDAKILFMPPINECRMNGSCAGGTGAFIDQMAELLGCDAAGLDELSKDSEVVYTIASRCGVFAKSDIQPLLNQGARKADIAESIFHAIVNQTISGLAQGRKIEGNVLYLGGPLYFLKNLRSAFDKRLGTSGRSPENSLFYVALGSVFSSISQDVDIDDLITKIDTSATITSSHSLPALFESEDEYNAFKERHKKDDERVKIIDNPDIERGYLGIDAGSTTIKAVLIDEDKNIVDTMYCPTTGTVIDTASDYIKHLYSKYPKLEIVSSCTTGYGEELIKNAFSADWGIVETMAHFKAARHFVKDVDFIIDIGGQDIKCFMIRSGAIDSLFLNEACSSGCGSFLSTFASIAGFDIQQFSTLALKSKNPCDLGSRCTVFMNSSVKQAQKDGASIEDIAAGLCISVVKNALYKVIRTSKNKIGDNIVVQGGTFMSDAVLRAFEKEVGKNCIRPKIAGLMGAFGCALFAFENQPDTPHFISRGTIGDFSYKSQAITCQGCTNSCKLNINTFSNSLRFISGNKCDKPLGKSAKEHCNIFQYKRELLSQYKSTQTPLNKTKKPVIGLPLGLNMYEFLPFWHTLFTELGFDVLVSEAGDRELYLSSQHSVPSDTVCYPAKLMHGSIEDLVRKKADVIFYPNMTYNTDEKRGDNHYNCPVVAYYPELLGMNYDFKNTEYFSPFVDLSDRKKFSKSFYKLTAKSKIAVSYSALKKASDKAFDRMDKDRDSISRKAEEFIKIATEKGLRIAVLAGRPYHIDSEVNHKIDELLCNMGSVVLSEDSVFRLSDHPQKRSVLDQWTYHSRLYGAADWAASRRDVCLIQLVSFGCGIDAITQDECRRIIESSGGIYTSIKIDEIENLGAAKIRLRSLFAVLDEKKC